MNMQQLRTRIKEVLIARLNLDVTPADIDDEAVLFGAKSPLNLDSVDSLEFIMGIEKEFNIDFSDDDAARVLKNISTVAAYVQEQTGQPVQAQ
jgi:acyl carrier protein